MAQEHQKPRVFAVSAPSGAGKTSLNRRLVQEHPSIALSISYTARPRRPDEIDGEHYHFVSPESFRERIERGEMLEYAEVFGNLYGTSRAEIERIHGLGHHVLLEIDVQGWYYARNRLRQATSVFILPPSARSLWDRLEKRATESKAVRLRRLETAASELEAADIYDHFIVNDDFDKAYAELVEILVDGKPGRMDRAEGVRRCAALLAELKGAPWLANLRKEMEEEGPGR